jgi:hypothetical protein
VLLVCCVAVGRVKSLVTKLMHLISTSRVCVCVCVCVCVGVCLLYIAAAGTPHTPDGNRH